MHVVSGRNSVADPAGGFWDEVGGGGEEGRGLAPPPLQTCRIFFLVILRHQTSCNDRITYYYSTLSFSLHLPWNIC